MYKKIHLDTDYNFFLGQKIVQGTTCIKHQVYELTDIHNKFGGFPESYNLSNTTIHQKFYNKDECDYEELGIKLGIDVVTVSTIMQPPGNTIPIHRDTFFQIKKKYPDNKKLIVRANIYLEDWKTGHFLQYNDSIDTHWKQGDGHMWDSEVLHIGANSGMENKYTLQVSGFLNKS